MSSPCFAQPDSPRPASFSPPPPPYACCHEKQITIKIQIDDLTEQDIKYDLTQKGVDIKIGLDIASLSIKKMVTQIILISGDSDFVPATKTARREGVDFILEPMWNPINPNLHEHIDGLMSTCFNPTKPFAPNNYPYIL